MPTKTILDLFTEEFTKTLKPLVEDDDGEIAAALAKAAEVIFKAGTRKLRTDAAAHETAMAAASSSAAAIGEELEFARARIAALEAQLATATATGGGKKAKAAPAPKPKKGRMVNQILTVNLTDGEVVFRKTGGKLFEANWVAKDKHFNCTALGKAYASPSGFAKACAEDALGDTSKSGHAINGWDVCWVERDGKKYKLSQLRTAAAPPEEEAAPAPAPAAGGAGGGAAAEDEEASGDDDEESGDDEEDDE
jgi:hypothetical protein